MPGQPSGRNRADVPPQLPAGIEVRELGRLLRLRRGEQHLSIRQAAAAANVSFSTLSRVEAGAQPDLTTFLQLCAWLSVDASDFLNPTPRRHADPIEEAARHLMTDPNLSVEAADRIVLVLREMYRALSAKENQSQQRTTVTLHLRAASIMRPGVPERLASVLRDMRAALDAKVPETRSSMKTAT